MKQTRKGNNWYFGVKAHIGVDAASGLVHTVVTTGANVNDLNVAGQLLHGTERVAFGDSGYQGVHKPILLRVLAEADISRTRSVTDDLATARSYAKDKPELIDLAIAELESASQAVEPRVVSAVKSMRVDQWVHLRHTKKFVVFIDKKVENAYEVRALTTPLNELVDDRPYTFEAGLFEYKGLYICDGFAVNPVALGPGYRTQFGAAYTAIRKAGRLHARTAA
jgi:predicted transcriptional regulator